MRTCIASRGPGAAAFAMAFVGVYLSLCAGRATAQIAPAPAPAAPTPAVRPALVVVPFNNGGRDPRGYWLREASAVILTDDLVSFGVSAMSRDERVRAFESLRVPAVADLSHATVIRVGQIVGAARVVIGSCDVTGDTLTVRARSILLESGQLSSEIAETGPLADLFAIYGRVARRLATDVLPGTAAVETSHPPIAAFEQYIKGLLAEAPAMKLSFLREALRLAPSLHRARIAIWGVHTELGEHQTALTTVRQVPATHSLAREASFLASVSLVHLDRYQEAFDTLTDLNRVVLEASLFNNLGIVQLRRPPGATGRRAVAYFSDAAALDGGDSDLLFNLGYAYWLDRDLPNAIHALREAVRRRPTDDAAHYVLGVALQMSGNGGEGARERELARRLSSEYAEWEATQPAPNTVPKGLERVRTELTVRGGRVESEIVAAGQRDQQELAAFHVDAGRRAFLAERDDEAIAAFRRAVYLAPYDAEAHLLLGRVYVRGGRLIEAVDEFTISVWSRDTIAARLALAGAYIQTQNVNAARSELQVVLGREPANAEARRLQGRLPPE
jgi:tetratricopeptide (TPR) repeat protein